MQLENLISFQSRSMGRLSHSQCRPNRRLLHLLDPQTIDLRFDLATGGQIFQLDPGQMDSRRGRGRKRGQN